MAGNVTTDLLFFTATGADSSCDSATGWTTSFTPDTETKVQGTGAASAKVSNTTYINTFTCTNNVDMTNKNVYAWMLCLTVGSLDTKENGGFRVRLTDSTGSYSEWYVGGKTVGGIPSYQGGYECFCVNVNTTPNATSGVLSKPTVNRVSVTCKTTATTSKNNFLWDAVRYGTSLQIDGGTSGSPATFADFVTAEQNNTNMWGVIRSYKGILLVQGKLKFGSTTNAVATYFKDTTSPILLFLNSMYSEGFCDVIFQGNAGANTEIYFGTKSGDAGVQGPIFKSESTSNRFNITANGTNITKYGVCGSIIDGPNVITLADFDVNKDFLSNTVSKNAEMLPGTGRVGYCNFLSSPGRALRLSSTSHTIASCSFIGCQTGINVTVAGTSSFPNLKFSNNTYDIENSSPGDVTISAIYGSNPSTVNNSSGHSTTINNNKVLTISGLISGSEARIYKDSDNSELAGIEVSDTSFVYEYNYVSDIASHIVVFKNDYIALWYSGITLGVNGYSLLVQQQKDRQYNNPA